MKKEPVKIEEQNTKEQADRLLLRTEIALGAISTASFLIILFVAIYAMKKLSTYVVPIILIVVAVAIFAVGCAVCLRIEQKAGYYECKKCHHKYVPTFKQTFLAPHCGRTRCFKCPKCGEKSWNKKVIK